MPAISINAVMNTEEDNIFNFIHDKLFLGVGDYEYYLTDKGSYIVSGKPFYSGIEEWAKEQGISENCDRKYKTYDECPPKVKALLEKKYYQTIAKWLKERDIPQDELKMLELLHLQFKAIEDYSKGIDPDNAKKIIAGTQIATGKNCLEYLLSLKEMSGPIQYNPGKYYWTSMTDRQGSQLCAALTGIDPSRISRFDDDDYDDFPIFDDDLPIIDDDDLPIIMENAHPDRGSLLDRMHNQFLQYQGLINEITEEQTEILRSSLDEIYYNSDASVHSRILNMVKIATEYFKDRDIAIKYISNNYDTKAREIDIKNEHHSKGK